MTLLEFRTRCKLYTDYLTNVPGDLVDAKWDEAIYKGVAQFVQYTHLPFGWRTLTDTADTNGIIDISAQRFISIKALRSNGVLVRQPNLKSDPLTQEQWAFVNIPGTGEVTRWTRLDPARIGVAPAQGASARTLKALGAYNPLPAFADRVDGTDIPLPLQVEDVAIILSVAIMADPYQEGSIMERMKTISSSAFEQLQQLNERALGDGAIALQ